MSRMYRPWGRLARAGTTFALALVGAFIFNLLFSLPLLAQEELAQALGAIFIVAIFAILISIAYYIFFALCLQKIARKLGIEPAGLAWIPIANMWLWVKVAGKEDWWVIFLVLPVFTGLLPDGIEVIVDLICLLVAIYLLFEVPRNLGKSPWLALWTLVPIAGVFIYLSSISSD